MEQTIAFILNRAQLQAVYNGALSVPVGTTQSGGLALSSVGPSSAWEACEGVPITGLPQEDLGSPVLPTGPQDSFWGCLRLGCLDVSSCCS